MSHATDTEHDTANAHSDPIWLLLVAIFIAGGALFFSHKAQLAQPAGETAAGTGDDLVVAVRDPLVETLEDPKTVETPPPGQEFVDAAKDPQVLALGKKVFKARCVVCHADHGQGNIGPNLCDEYWIHGHTAADIHRSIDVGNPAAGMVAWGKMLPEEEIRAVTAFVISLRGTDPPLPKAPQGEKRPD